MVRRLQCYRRRRLCPSPGGITRFPCCCGVTWEELAHFGSCGSDVLYDEAVRGKFEFSLGHGVRPLVGLGPGEAFIRRGFARSLLVVGYAVPRSTGQRGG